MKFFTQKQLIEAATLGPKWDFNRQIRLAPVQRLPEAKFPVSHTLVHAHRHGQPCQKHVRCIVELGPNGFLIVDVPIAFYKKLGNAKVNRRCRVA